MADGHEPVPDDFDTEVDGLPAKAVEHDRLPCLFHLTTHCVLAGEEFAVDAHDGDRLRLRWTGTDPATAARLGLELLGDPGSFGTEAGVGERTALWQVRRDLHRVSPPSGDATGDATGVEGSATQRLLHRIGHHLDTGALAVC
ncbi:hypothetical protein [Haloechinothrix alba]|uniref:hypothetical protein n=1 Tax=Haloechinothrix alba TaxID=664784 RepID=UPI0011316A9F|nr:hypothetical protein [Haloechinothrix alba]